MTNARTTVENGAKPILLSPRRPIIFIFSMADGEWQVYRGKCFRSIPMNTLAFHTPDGKVAIKETKVLVVYLYPMCSYEKTYTFMITPRCPEGELMHKKKTTKKFYRTIEDLRAAFPDMTDNLFNEE